MDKRPNRLRLALAQGRPTLGTRVETTWPFITELAASSGMYDYIQFDGEYAPYTQADVENICRASELHGCATVVKVDRENSVFLAQKAIASGAHGILFADIYTAGEVRDCIRRITPSSPGGGLYGRPNRRHGMNGSGRMKVRDYVAQTNEVVKLIMVEKQETMDNLEDICSVPGVDMVSFGPHDYAMNSGWEPEEHAADLEAVHKKMIETALRCGVQVQVMLNDTTEMRKYYDWGVRHFNIGDELCTQMEFHALQGAKARALLA